MALTDEQYRKVMRKGWNLTVDEYDRSWVSVLRSYAVGCVERAEVGAGDRVIDVASGPGTAALLAAERVGANGEVVGTDIADSFVAAATARASAVGAKNVRFERHPMEALAVADASFDVATCVLGLMYAAPVASALSEMRRVLRPGGRFAACVWGERAKCGFRDVFPILSEVLQMDVCPLFFALGAPGAFASSLEAAGFTDARVERVDVTLHWKSDAAACAAMFDGGPAAYPYSLFDDATKAKVCDAYARSLGAHARDGAYAVPAEFVYATARVA
jgi:ubiquinone/menaquinone biosynthesis C-methylase UbiE